jgi:predicted kinase
MNRPQQLLLIAIYGPAGAGKTTLVDLLHDELSYTAHIGVDHIKRFISEFRDIPAHQEVSRKVIYAMTAGYLKNGINVICEQGMSRLDLETLEGIAKDAGAKFLAYRLDASQDVADERASKRQAAAGKAPVSKEEADKLFRAHQENDYPHARILDSETMSTQQMADEVLKDIET